MGFANRTLRVLMLGLFTATYADEAGQPCSTHGDCARDAYCTRNLDCAKCEDGGDRVCHMWGDSVDGSCVRCDGEPEPLPRTKNRARRRKATRSQLEVANDDDSSLPLMTIGERRGHVVYSNAFSPAECESVLQESQTLQSQGGVVGTGTSADSSTRRSEIRWVPRDPDSPLAWIYPRILRLMLAANEKVWNYRPTELENIQIGTYAADDAGYYDWHADRSSSSAGNDIDRVLSGSLQLASSDMYEGGELQLGHLVRHGSRGHW